MRRRSIGGPVRAHCRDRVCIAGAGRRPRITGSCDSTVGKRAGDPERAATVAPDPPRALTRHWRLQDRDGAGLKIDLAEIVASERGEEHLAVRRGGDAVGAGAARRVEYRHSACFGIEPTIDAVLPGEPEHALAIKARGVEVGVAPFLGQREELHRTGDGIDLGDRVLPTFR